MTQHAKEYALKLIKEKEIDKGDGYENITVRIDKKQWAMLTVLTKYFNLKANSVFTEILSKEIYEMVRNLKKDALDEFKGKIKIYYYSSGAKKILLENNIIKNSSPFAFLNQDESE